ncbi:helix-turn-helix domain-containing protein [bacterium]|nr:helix-turn-helix domain-containing protein [bacterium]
MTSVDRLREMGTRIRRLRLAAEMTQEELAERSNLTAGFISQIERGKTSISIDSLMMILDTLNIHISDFFRPTAERVVFHKEEALSLERDGIDEFLVLVPGAGNRTMEPVRVQLLFDQEAVLEPFSGEQFGYILRGEVQVRYGRDEELASAGESFFADGQHEVGIKAVQKEGAEFIWVTSPPYF